MTKHIDKTTAAGGPVRRDAAEFEQRSYQAILDAMPDMIICIDREGVFLNFKGDTNELYRPMDTYMGKRSVSR